MRQRTFQTLLLRGLLFAGLAVVMAGCASGDYSGQGSVSMSMYGYYGYNDPMYYGHGAPVPPPPPGMRPPPGGARPPAPPHASQLPSRPMPAPAPRPMPRGGGGRR